MLVDLHTHSTSSDGTYTPAKLVEAAAAAKIGVLALTDHDSVNGIVQAEAAAVNIKNRSPHHQRRRAWYSGR